MPKKQEINNDYEVWDHNWDIVMMFLKMSTQSVSYTHLTLPTKG